MFRSFSLLRALGSNIRLTIRLLREPRVPLWAKAIPALAIAYFISPIDIVPDVLFPILGELDDLMLLVLAQQAFLYLCPTSAREFHRSAVAARRPYSPIGPKDDFIDI